MVKQSEFSVFFTGHDAEIVPRKHGINPKSKNLESESKTMSESVLIRLMPYLHPIDVLAKYYIRSDFW